MMNLSVLELSTLEVFSVTCLIDGTTILRVIKKSTMQTKQKNSKKQIANNTCI